LSEQQDNSQKDRHHLTIESAIIHLILIPKQRKTLPRGCIGGLNGFQEKRTLKLMNSHVLHLREATKWNEYLSSSNVCEVKKRNKGCNAGGERRGDYRRITQALLSFTLKFA